MTSDPVRWSDPSSGISSGLRTLLDSVVVDEPTNAQLDRVTSGLAEKLGMPMPASAQVGSAPVATGGKIALALGIVAVVAIGLVVWVTAGARAPKAAPPTISLVEHTEPVAVAPARESVTQQNEPPPPAPDRTPTEIPPKAATTEVPPADDELSMLEAAQAALASDPTGALALAERHAARFTHGVLREEREAIAIEALVALDRIEQARVRFAQFVAEFPRSGYRVRLARRLAPK